MSKPNVNELWKKKDVGGLIKALGNSDGKIRWGAAEALGEIGDKRAVNPLITALSDEYSHVRMGASSALGKIGNVRAIDPLIAALGDRDENVRSCAADALAKIGEPIDLLITVLRDGDSPVRRGAVEALGRIGDPRAVMALEKTISDSDEDVRDKSEEALGKIKSTETYKEYLKSSAFISSIESVIRIVEGLGCEISSVLGLLKAANSAFDIGNYEEAIEYAKQGQETVKRIQEESKPEMALKFPEGIFKLNAWKRIEITITNTGSMHAKKIKIEPSSDIEFRRIPTIPQLDKNETKTMTIGMKPTVMGDVPIDVAITFTDALDREYTSSEERWLLIAESTPMSESISISEFSPRQWQSEYKYQVALSFAGEDRKYAEGLAELLKENGINFFYDWYEQADLWGKNLYQHLQSVYRDKAQYCVVFLSQAYAQKLWTRHELESAQARAFREHQEYILPVKIDDTEIPGINETIGYIDLRLVSLEEIADMIVKKLSFHNLEE